MIQYQLFKIQRSAENNKLKLDAQTVTLMMNQNDVCVCIHNPQFLFMTAVYPNRG